MTPSTQSLDATQVLDLIRKRRAIFPRDYSGAAVSRADIELLLESAHWAPTHGRTEPWHFQVFTGPALARIGEAQAEVYRLETAPESFKEAQCEKLKTRLTECAAVIAICMRRGDKAGIPDFEEEWAVACAVQNMWLCATALGLAGYWSTGGFSFLPGMNALFDLGEADRFMGFFMLGQPKDPAQWPEGSRKTAWQEKVQWIES